MDGHRAERRAGAQQDQDQVKGIQGKGGIWQRQWCNFFSQDQSDCRQFHFQLYYNPGGKDISQ